MSEAPTFETGRITAPETAGARVAELYTDHGRAVYGLCRLMLRDAGEAEDAAQSAFLAAHHALVRGIEPSDQAAWLFAIARNECRGRIRERMTTPLVSGDEALAELEAPEGDPAQRITDPLVRKALAALPERQREAVLLHDVFGLRSREVGRVLGLSLPAVEALLFRARRQLRVRLRPIAGALTLPLGLRDALAQAIPGFADGSGVAGVAATGAVGAGLLAKLATAPAAAKVAAATVAVTAAGTVAVTESGRVRDGRAKVPAPVTDAAVPVTQAREDRSSGNGGDTGAASRSGGAVVRHEDSAGSSESGSDHDPGRSGPGTGAPAPGERGDDDGHSDAGGSEGPGPGGDASQGTSATATTSSDPDTDDEPPDGSGHSGPSRSGSNDVAAADADDSGSSGSGSSGSDSSGSGSSGSGSSDSSGGSGPSPGSSGSSGGEPSTSDDDGASGTGSSGSSGSGSGSEGGDGHDDD